MFRLILGWCAFYTIIMFLSASKSLSEADDIVKMVLRALSFGSMLVGTIGVYKARRWGAWLSASTLGLLTAWLPFGYQWLISNGGHAGPFLMIFAGLAGVNSVAMVYLARIAYLGVFPTEGRKPKPSSYPSTPSPHN